MRVKSLLVAIPAALVVVVGWVVADANRPQAPLDPRVIEADGGHALALPDGRLLEYFVTGQPGQPVAVMHHGGVTTGHSIVDIGGIPGWRVIAPTYPGFGGSTPNPSGTMDSFAEDVRRLLDHVAPGERVVIVGGSWGGSLGLAVAVGLARARPGSVRGALLGSPAMPAQGDFPGYSAFLVDPVNRAIQHRIMPSPLGPVLVKYLYRTIFAGDPRKLFEGFGEGAFEGMEAFAADMRRSVRWYLSGQPDLQRIATTNRTHIDWAEAARVLEGVPVRLWVGDKDDGVVPEVSKYVERELKKAGHRDVTLTIVPGGTHFWLRNIVHEPLASLAREIAALEASPAQ